MIKKEQLTRAGYNNLKDELRNLIDFEKEDVKKQLAEARAQGDLSENADYTAAKARLAAIEARIVEIEEILNNCEIIEEKRTTKGEKKIAIGNTVELEFVENGKRVTYTIVGTIESDPFHGRISQNSPVGSALIGKKVGDVVEIKAGVTYSLKVINF